MHLDLERGNIAQAFAESDVIVEDTFTSMPQWHCSIETIGSVAEYATSGKYTIYMNTQTLFNARYRIATALGVPETDVRIIQSAVGGGFGGKSCDDNNALVAAVLAKKARKPVKLINTREEEFLAGCRPRVFMKINVKMGFKKDGRIRAKELKVIADNGAYSAKAPAITGVAAMRHDTCYKYSDVKIDAKLVYTNKIPTGAFRGFGNPSAEWAVEQAIDLGRPRARHRSDGARPHQRRRSRLRFAARQSRHQLRAQAVPRHDRKDDRLESQARQQSSRTPAWAWPARCTSAASAILATTTAARRRSRSTKMAKR